MSLRSFFTFWLILFSTISVWSQSTSRCDTCIIIVPNDGCIPLTVKAKQCGYEGSPEYYYGDEVIIPPNKPTFGLRDSVHTYTEVGVFTVFKKDTYTCPPALPTIKTIRSGPTGPISIRVRPVPDPLLSAFPCSGGKVMVANIDTQYDSISVFTPLEIPIARSNSVIIPFSDTLSRELNTKGEYAGLHCGASGKLNVQSYSVLHDPVVYSITTTSPNQITLSFKAEKYHRYEIQMRTGFIGNYIAIDTLTDQIGTVSFPIGNLNTTQNSYCFQVRAFDYCTEQKLSAEYCSVILSGSAQNKQNELKWTDYPGLSATNYTLLVNGNAPSPDFSTRPSSLAYTDTTLICGGNYCYQIKVPLSGGTVSLSNTVCLIAVSNSTPPAVKGIESSVSNNQAVVTWTASAASPATYSVYSSTNFSAYGFLGTTTTASYSDNQDPSSASYCYKVDYHDNCGNTAPLSGITCPVYLSGQVVSALSRAMSWTSYTGWEEGIKEYIVEKVDVNGVAYFTKSVGNTFSYADSVLDTTQQVIYFRVKAVSNTGRESYSNVFKSQQDGKIYMPNAFTPNGDGLNDVFHAEGLFIEEFKIEIWSRNGEGVFSSHSIHKGWDGTVNGQKVPADAYMYQVVAKDKSGKTFKPISGTVQLIR